MRAEIESTLVPAGLNGYVGGPGGLIADFAAAFAGIDGRECVGHTLIDADAASAKFPAYLTDAGMCGDYDSVIGMKKEVAMQRFIRKMPGERLSPAEGEGTLCAALVETDDKTGLALCWGKK